MRVKHNNKWWVESDTDGTFRAFKYRKCADRFAQKVADRTGFSAYYYHYKNRHRAVLKGRDVVKCFIVLPNSLKEA